MRGVVRGAARIVREESGATAIEYALIAGLIAIAMLAGLIALGGGLGESWNDTAQRVTEAMRGQ